MNAQDAILKLKTALAFSQTGVANPELLSRVMSDVIDQWAAKLEAEAFTGSVLALATERALNELPAPSKVEWKCPRCGAPPNNHGKGGRDRCQFEGGSSCMGFICDCEGNTPEGHGDTAENACPNANCYHCGWGGTFPPPPFKLTGWVKTAWNEGWRPPAGWVPPAKVDK